MAFGALSPTELIITSSDDKQKEQHRARMVRMKACFIIRCDEKK